MTVQVKCVTCGDDHLDGCEAITTIGWVNTDSGKAGQSSPKQMYEYVDDGGRAFVEYKGESADLVPVDGEHKKHVRTEPGTSDQNLIKQPDC